MTTERKSLQERLSLAKIERQKRHNAADFEWESFLPIAELFDQEAARLEALGPDAPVPPIRFNPESIIHSYANINGTIKLRANDTVHDAIRHYIQILNPLRKKYDIRKCGVVERVSDNAVDFSWYLYLNEELHIFTIIVELYLGEEPPKCAWVKVGEKLVPEYKLKCPDPLPSKDTTPTMDYKTLLDDEVPY